MNNKHTNVLGCAQISSHRKKYQINLESTKDNPSIVFYDNHDEQKAIKSASISLLDTKYTDGNMKLDEKQKKSLIKFLESPSGAVGFKGMTNWQKAIVLFNQNFINMDHDWTKFTKKVKKQNENKWKFNKFKFALPFDLPIPNYLQLQ